MLKQYLKNIADAIRAKLGTTDKVNAQDFAGKVNEVYEKSNLEAFKLYCHDYYGTVTIPHGITKLKLGSFYHKSYNGLIVPDTVETVENGVCSNMTSLETFRLPKLKKPFSVANFWGGCTSLHTLTFEDPTDFRVITGNFYNCNALTTIIFEGGKLTNDWYFQQAPISVESMKHIIEHLTNYAGTDKEGVHTIRFSDSCWNALEADSKAPGGGTWQSYVQSLGWNL